MERTGNDSRAEAKADERHRRIGGKLIDDPRQLAPGRTRTSRLLTYVAKRSADLRRWPGVDHKPDWRPRGILACHLAIDPQSLILGVPSRQPITVHKNHG